MTIDDGEKEGLGLGCAVDYVPKCYISAICTSTDMYGGIGEMGWDWCLRWVVELRACLDLDLELGLCRGLGKVPRNCEMAYRTRL